MESKKVIILAFILLSSGRLFSQYNDFTIFLDKGIEEYNLTSNSDQAIRKYASKFVEVYNYGLIYEFINYNPITKTWNLKTEVLPYKLRTYNWNGTTKGLKKNLLGQIKNVDEETCNNIIVSIILEYIKKNSRSNL